MKSVENGSARPGALSAVFCVCVDARGAHEAECVYSVWTTQEAADAEAKRLNTSGASLGCYGGMAFVVSIKLNEPRNEWIG